MTQRQKLRAAKIALAGRLLWKGNVMREEFGDYAINMIAETLLMQARYPLDAKVPDDAYTAKAIVLGINVEDHKRCMRQPDAFQHTGSRVK